MSKTEHFNRLYDKERKKIDALLKKSLSKRNPRSLYEPAAYILDSGGKRIRPMLVLFSAYAVGGKFSNAYNAACAVEMLHNFTLVHDDIMDNSDKRRGLITLHKKYDLSTAILAGDSLLSVAYEYLLKDVDTCAKDVVAAFTQGVSEVCEGQSYDKEFEIQKDVSLKEYLVMIRKKTAVMAEMACYVGASIGNGTDEQRKALSLYGRNIGMAFQIQDDLLDLIADEKYFGKKIGIDLIEGKKTYLYLKSLQKAKGKKRKALLEITKNKGTTKENIPYYASLYEELGVFEDAKKAIKRYTTNALKNLDVLDNKEAQDLFEWLANLLLNRTK